MKFLHAAAFAMVLTVAGSPALRAQEPDQDKEKPKQQQDEKKKHDQNEKEKPQPKPDARDNKEKPPADQPTREKAPARQEDRTNRSQQDQTAPRANQERNGQRNGNEQRNGNANERGEQGGNRSAHRIPEERYRQNFGREHHFRVARRDDRRVEYGGYSFQYSDEWPSDWSYDDDVYIVEDGDDYYLVDLNHPGIRLRLILVE